LSIGKASLPTFTFEWVIEDAKPYLGLERSPWSKRKRFGEGMMDQQTV
jgi:hypothetical protein